MVAQLAAAQSFKSVTLAWDYNPTDSLTNYYFTIRTSTNAVAPLPWTPLITVTNAKQANILISLTPGVSQFFYVTANDLRSNSTNFVFESDPSNVVSGKSLLSGTLSIGKGP